MRLWEREEGSEGGFFVDVAIPFPGATRPVLLFLSCFLLNFLDRQPSRNLARL